MFARLMCLPFCIFFYVSSPVAGCPPGNNLADVAAPTDLTRTFIRKGAGEFGAKRAGNVKHTGVDIVSRGSFKDRAAYVVKAIAPGTIAYAQFNGLDLDDGFGNVIVIDHGNDCYSMFAHLAGDPFTPSRNPSDALKVAIGQRVTKGQPIGYFVDVDKGVESTGNAHKTVAGARWQTHFELISAPSGRSGSGALRAIIIKSDGTRVDPQPLLRDLGYSTEELN